MESKSLKRLPKILKINRIDKDKLIVSVLFSTGEDRIPDFNKILKKDWKINKTDAEYKLLKPVEFGKMKLINNSLSWSNVELFLSGINGKRERTV